MTTTKQARKKVKNTHLVKLLHPDCRVSTYALKPELQISQADYDRIWADRPNVQETFNAFGKEHLFPRLFKHYLRDYKWSGKLHKGEPLTDPYIIKLLQWVQDYTGLPYNQVLINWYEPAHYIGAHADDEHGMVDGAPIFSFSFGAERIFRINAKKSIESAERHDVQLQSNTVVVMRGKMQKHYKHEVLKQSSKRPVAGTRINCTMRYML